MDKKKVLFVVHQLNYGGVQKSLISALNAIDYGENEVTLYIRKNRINLIEDVNENVSRVIVNEDKTHYYRKPFVVCLMVLEFICDFFNLSKKKEKIHQKLVEYINEAQMKYEKKHYFNSNEVYDVAVSYIQGYTGKFVADYITARKKVMLYHSSYDEKHDLHQNVMREYDYIAGVSKDVCDMLKEAYPDYLNKIGTLNNYTDPETIKRRAIEDKLESKNVELVISTCGRFAKEKGFGLAVEAAKELKDKGIDFYWYFIGDGAERNSIQKRIDDLDLNANIEITGMKHNPYIYIEDSDIYVQPSYEESYGITISEAMILNKPVVSTSTIGGRTQIVNNKSGLLVDFSGKEIAEGILKYKEDKTLKEKVIENLKNVDHIKPQKEYELQWKEVLED